MGEARRRKADIEAGKFKKGDYKDRQKKIGHLGYKKVAMISPRNFHKYQSPREQREYKESKKKEVKNDKDKSTKEK